MGEESIEKEYDVAVDTRKMSLDIIIPVEYMKVFAQQFGDRFPFYNSLGVREFPGKIDRYYPHLNSWHVVVRIQKNEEEKLDSFLPMFCARKGLPSYEVGVYERKMSLDIIIPVKYMEVFARQFGEEFPLGVGELPRGINRYYPHLNDWHVVVGVYKNEGERFDNFLYKFCAERELSLRPYKY